MQWGFQDFGGAMARVKNECNFRKIQWGFHNFGGSAAGFSGGVGGTLTMVM